MEGEVWWGWGWPNDVGSIDIDLSRFSFAAGFLMTTLMAVCLRGVEVANGRPPDGTARSARLLCTALGHGS